MKGKLAIGVGSKYSSHYLGTWCITTADAHTSAASNRLNWRPRRFKWTRPFRRKTKSGFCACAITFQLSSTRLPPVYKQRHRVPSWVSRLTVGIKADCLYIPAASYPAPLVSCNWILSVLRNPCRSREWIICCHTMNDDSFVIKFLCARTHTLREHDCAGCGPRASVAVRIVRDPLAKRSSEKIVNRRPLPPLFFVRGEEFCM